MGRGFYFIVQIDIPCSSPGGSGECVPVCGSLVSIDGSFVVYRGISNEEDSTLLYKLTSPAHFPVVHLSGVRQSVYSYE